MLMSERERDNIFDPFLTKEDKWKKLVPIKAADNDATRAQSYKTFRRLFRRLAQSS